MHAWVFEVSRNHCAYHIASTKTVLELLLFRLRAWEAMLIHQAQLPTAMSGGGDEQWHDPFDSKLLRRTLPDTGSIQPMRLGQVSPAAVVLRQPTRPTLNWQAQGLELLVKLPARGIDGSCIFDGSPGLGQQPR